MDPGWASSENETASQPPPVLLCPQSHLGDKVLGFKASTVAGVQGRRELGLNDNVTLFSYGPDSTRIY